VAIGATVHRFEIELSDIGRGVYQALDLRVARHPSEALPFLVTRVLAYCGCWVETLEMGRGGVSSGDEPALIARDPTGRILLWVEVGVPSADRVHKAAKAADRVVIFAHRTPAALLDEAKRRSVYRAEDVELYEMDAALLGALGALVERKNVWRVLIDEGRVYVTVGDATFEAPFSSRALG
jgi:uncharacterized protein YaeQ